MNKKSFLTEFIQSENKTYFILKNSKIFMIAFAVIGAFFGFLGFLEANKWKLDLSIINNTVALFLMQWENEKNILVDLAKFFALLTILFGGISYYFYRFHNSLKIKNIQKKSFDLLVGLGEQNSNFLNNLSNKERVLVIEKDKNNPFLEKFKNSKAGIIIGDAREKIKEINLDNLKNTIISTGDDRVNISIAVEISDQKKEEKDKEKNNKNQNENPKEDNKNKQKNQKDNSKLFINISNSDIAVLFKQEVVAKDSSKDVIIYSLDDILIKDMFKNHTILGEFKEIIHSSNEFNIAIVGDSSLALRLIYHIALLSNLPNENRLNLYLVNKDAKKFLDRVKKQFSNIEKIEHLNLIAYELDSNTLEFFKDKLWKIENLTNIFIVDEDENKNLDIAINLQDTTYPLESAKGYLKTKILFAIYHDLGISKKINENKDVFKNFYSFANFEKVINEQNIIDEELDLIAKLIHYSSYLGEKEINKEELNKKWLELSFFKRDSNRSQALHIDIKLLALNLSKQKSSKSLKELLAINQKIFSEAIKIEEKDTKFPKEFNTLISKLAMAEHNRWNSFHYLHGWEYCEIRDNKAKRHHCLLPFSKFTTQDQKDTYKYDIDSIKNIPLYLAHAGYEIVNIKKKKEVL